MKAARKISYYQGNDHVPKLYIAIPACPVHISAYIQPAQIGCLFGRRNTWLFDAGIQHPFYCASLNEQSAHSSFPDALLHIVNAIVSCADHV